MNTALTQLNDLTIIKGIGPTRQAWLRKSFSVYTCADLAALSPEAIEVRLKAEKQIVARSEIESWIAQAQALSTAALRGEVEGQLTSVPPPTLTVASAVPMTPSEAPTATSSKAKQKAVTNGKTTPVDWKASARFVVEFQANTEDQPGAPNQHYRTVANHLDLATDHLLHSQSWSGLERDHLCAWMLEQVKPPEQAVASQATPALPKPAPPAVVRMNVTQIRLFQPPHAPTPSAIGEVDRLFQGVITGGDPFALEVAFALAESISISNTGRISYRAQFYLRDLITGITTHLGETEAGALSAGQTTYTARLPATSLQTGLYRLQVLVSIESRPPTLGYFEIPLLQVV